ncbi:unnamed protein product [Calicophoron daubneyi]|uniref:Uncharacterized protein n=1 Tax=Calicophoron daubneyi TaxID=300641 RepID=A0AAV2SY32_CALDB
MVCPDQTLFSACLLKRMLCTDVSSIIGIFITSLIQSYTESKSKLYRMISEEMNFLKQLMAKVEQDSKADTELKAALKAYLDQNQRIREEVQCLLECHPDELSGRGNGKSYCHVL